MTTPDPTARWTPETEERGLHALWEFGHLGQPIGSDDEPAAIAWTRSAVRAVLTAAADSGQLLPPPPVVGDDGLREESTAAFDLAARVRRCLAGIEPAWTEEHPEPRLWRWREPEDEGGALIVVDGRNRHWLPALPEGAGRYYGPTLILHEPHGCTVRIDLPSCPDRFDLQGAVDALAHVGSGYGPKAVTDGE